LVTQLDGLVEMGNTVIVVEHDLRWVQRYAPILNQRVRRELRRSNGSWRVDETYVRIAGIWTYCTGPSIRLEKRLISCCRPSAI
jgi:transposase-like protein